MFTFRRRKLHVARFPADNTAENLENIRVKRQRSAAVIDEAARHAMEARQRIERAVNEGRLPAWVLDTCESWERAALSYGAAMARRQGSLSLGSAFHSEALH